MRIEPPRHEGTKEDTKKEMLEIKAVFFATADER
jgi:hypothetical protein